MSLLQNVHLAGSMESDDLYSGFNDYNHALDAEVPLRVVDQKPF